VTLDNFFANGEISVLGHTLRRVAMPVRSRSGWAT
jgi:hypothetical protein